MNINKTLDCTGLFCPMPIVNAKKELNLMKSGEVLEITADDIGFLKDLPAWCKLTGNELVEIKEVNGMIVGVVKKK